MILPHFTQNLEGLICQLPGRWDYQNPQAISWSPLLAIEEFQSLKEITMLLPQKFQKENVQQIGNKVSLKKKRQNHINENNDMKKH